VLRHPSRKAGGGVVSYDLDAAASAALGRPEAALASFLAAPRSAVRRSREYADASVSRIITKNHSSVLPRAKSVKIIARVAETDLMLPDAIIQTNLLLLEDPLDLNAAMRLSNSSS
jgi:hypothetical protein